MKQDTLITDELFDSVYFSNYIWELPEGNALRIIFQQLIDKLAAHGIDSKKIPLKDGLTMTGKLSIWARDYMPVQTSNTDFAQFIYNPDYLQFKKYKNYIPDTEKIDDSLMERLPPKLFNRINIDRYDIVMDGGNLVRCGKYAVMTEKIFEENPSKSPAKLLDELEYILNAEIILLPWDRRETYGHTDGLLRYVGNNTVVYMVYGTPDKNNADRRYNESFLKRLTSKLNVKELNFDDIDRRYPTEQMVNLRWAYMNWLQLGDLVIMPEFTDTPHSNGYAREFVRSAFASEHKDITIESVEATELVKLGGGFNCASWTIKKV